MGPSMSVQKIREYLDTNWKTVTAWGVLAVGLIFALFWKLNSLVPGYADAEAQTYQSSLSLHGIVDNPLNAPFLLAVKAMTYIHPDSYFVTRAVSAVGGLLVLVIFAALLRHWHDDRTAIIGTLLFGTSAWFLHTARLGTPNVMLFGVFCLVACGFWLKHTRSWLALLACFGGIAWLMYVPGMVWFVIVGVTWQWKTIDHVFKRHLLVVTSGCALFVAALAPLALAFYRHHGLIKQFLGLPAHWPNPIDILKNLVAAPYHLLVHNSVDPVTWLGNASIFSVFGLAMIVLGVYMYMQHWRLARTPIFIMIFLVTAGLMAIGSPVTFTVIMPFMYLIIAAGVSYVLAMWFKVFPRNPLARGVGWSLTGLLIGLAVMYQLTHYFVGWPQASATHAAFTKHEP